MVVILGRMLLLQRGDAAGQLLMRGVAAVHGVENRPMPLPFATVVILVPVVRAGRQDSPEHHHTHPDCDHDSPKHGSLLWVEAARRPPWTKSGAAPGTGKMNRDRKNVLGVFSLWVRRVTSSL